MYSIKVKGALKLYEIDEKVFRTKLEELCITETKEAVKVWLTERLKHIPGYTGTARGTLVPVGRLVGKVISRFSPSGPSGDQNRAKRKKFIHRNGRTFRAGFQYGKDYASASIQVKQESNKIRCTFSFDSELPYVARNDVNGPPAGFIMPSNPPWFSTQRGVKVWKKYVLKEIPKKLKLPRSAVKITVLRLS
jgi:hypothetical protein